MLGNRAGPLHTAECISGFADMPLKHPLTVMPDFSEVQSLTCGRRAA